MTLHVENISLLTSTADDLKASLLSMGKLIEGSMHMSRGYKSPQSNGFFSFQGNCRDGSCLIRGKRGSKRQVSSNSHGLAEG